MVVIVVVLVVLVVMVVVVVSSIIIKIIKSCLGSPPLVWTFGKGQKVKRK